MNILITGGAGFIGANLVRRLVKDKYKVHILQKKSSSLWRLKGVKDKVSIHNESLLNGPALTKLFKAIQPEIIYHSAAYGTYPNQTDAEKIIKTNIEGTFNLLSASKEIPYECFVNTSTSSEYGPKNKPMRELDVCQPISFYAVSKLSATLLSRIFAKVYNKPIVTLRLFSVYGPYEEKKRFIPTIINAVLKGKTIKLTKNKVRHDFIFVKDVVEAYLKAGRLGKKLQGEILNIGSGREYTNQEVAETLFKITGQKTPIEKEGYPARKWDNKHWVADTTLVSHKLNWRAKYSLTAGLKETYNWMLKNQKNYERQ